MGIGKLVKNSKAFEIVGVANDCQIGLQGCRITGNIDDVVESFDQSHGCVVQPGTGGVYKDSTEVVII